MISGRYELLDVIGEGGMGKVFRAHDRLYDQHIALKQVHVDDNQVNLNTTLSISEMADLNMILAHEFKTLATLRHPNIISVLDYGFDEDRTPYFTMELLGDSQSI
ncbi:MAG: hypothetical protein AAF125_21540, partial [Chloroflexota bacterium]